MEIESSDCRVRFREEATDPPRHTRDAFTDRRPDDGSHAERCPDEQRSSNVAWTSVLPRQASPSQPSTDAAAASDISNSERLYASMTEEGPSGDYRMMMQGDCHGRWTPTKGERTMTIEKAREARRNFYVGRKARNTEYFRSRRLRRAHCMENYISTARMPTKCRGTIFLPRSERSFGEQSKTSGKECSI